MSSPFGPLFRRARERLAAEFMMKNHNEESTIGAIIDGFAVARRALLPHRCTERSPPTHGACIPLRIPSWIAFSSS
jgi:hypothetical protein